MNSYLETLSIYLDRLHYLSYDLKPHRLERDVPFGFCWALSLYYLFVLLPVVPIDGANGLRQVRYSFPTTSSLVGRFKPVPLTGRLSALSFCYASWVECYQTYRLPQNKKLWYFSHLFRVPTWGWGSVPLEKTSYQSNYPGVFFHMLFTMLSSTATQRVRLFWRKADWSYVVKNNCR